MKPREAIQEFRRYIRDTQKTRYSDDSKEPMDYFRLAFEALWVRHRHLFYVARIVNQKPAVANVDTELELLDSAKEKLAHYMAFQSLQEDAEDSNNVSLARGHYDQFAAP